MKKVLLSVITASLALGVLSGCAKTYSEAEIFTARCVYALGQQLNSDKTFVLSYAEFYKDDEVRKARLETSIHFLADDTYEKRWYVMGEGEEFIRQSGSLIGVSEPNSGLYIIGTDGKSFIKSESDSLSVRRVMEAYSAFQKSGDKKKLGIT